MNSGALAGKAVVNTRAVHQAAELDALLLARGAQPVAYPCIEIAPPDDAAPLDDGLRALAAGEFGWLVLTSENAVIAVARRAETLGLRASDFGAVKVAAVGPKTAESAQSILGLNVHLVPEEHVAEALAAGLDAGPGSRMFLPHSSLARDTLEQALRAQGCAVTTADAYRTIPGSGGADVPSLLAARQIHALIFTSPSTVRNFCDRLASEGGKLADLGGVRLASIGPVTSAALEKAGLPVDVMPGVYTIADLVDALERHFEIEQSEKAS